VPASFDSTPDADTSPPATRVVRTALPLHVIETTFGSDAPDRATFLLIHGYGGSSYMWRHWVRPLAERGRVVVVDLKGFGEAPKPTDDRYSPVDLARLVVELVRELDLRALTLVGQSLGGGVALIAAVLLRESEADPLRRMVLLAPAAYRQRLPPLVPLSRRPRLSAALLRLIGVRRVVKWVLRSIVYDERSVSEDQVVAYAEALSTPEGRRSAFAVGRQIVPDGLETWVRRYPTVDVPVLLLWGDADRVIPGWVGRRLEEELPNARLVLVKRCGHLACEERPEASLALVERFLDAHPT